MQEAKLTSSTLIKWSAAGLDLSTTYHLTNSRNLGFLKSDMSSVKWQETKVHWGISEEHWQDSKEEGQHGKARTHVSCSTKEDAWSRHLSVDTGTFTSGVEKKDMFTPFYDALYIYTLWVYNAIWPSLQIRSTLTQSYNLLPSSLLSRYHWWLTYDHVWASPITTLMDEPQTDGHPLQLLSLSLLSPIQKCCGQFVRPFTLFSNSHM